MVILEEFISPQQVEVLRDTTYELSAVSFDGELPGAMAARALYPDRAVILLSGDGSFTFTVAELECAARQGLPFVAVVADDECWGIVSGHQQR